MDTPKVPLLKRGRYFRDSSGHLVRYWRPPRWTYRDTFFALCLLGLMIGGGGAGLGGQLNQAWIAVLGGVLGVGVIIGAFAWLSSR